MSSWTGGWRVALRMARRDARRHIGTVLLASVLVGLPIATATAADILMTTHYTTQSTLFTRAIGTADASFTLETPGQPIIQGATGSLSKDGSGFQASDAASASPSASPSPSPSAEPSSGAQPSSSQTTAPPPTPSLAAQLAQVKTFAPHSTHLIVRNTGTGGAIENATGMLGDVNLIEQDMADPLSQGQFQIVSGSVPHEATQIFVTRPVAIALDLSVGSTVSVNGKAGFTVSGTGYVLSANDTRYYEGVIGVPGAFGLAASIGKSNDPTAASPTFFLTSSTPIDVSVLTKANAQGYLVTSPYFAQHPTSDARSYDSISLTGASPLPAILIVFMILVLIQVILLVGPAFLVSARRMRHDMAISSAVGATPAQLRRTVLSGGVIAGLFAGLGGVVLGIPLGLLAAKPWGDFHIWGSVLGPIRLPWAHFIVLIAFGLGTAMLAALFPAIGAARRETRRALSLAPRGSRRSRRIMPIIGICLLILGIVTVAWAIFWEPNFVTGRNATQTIGAPIVIIVLAEIGVIFLVPSLIRAGGSLGRHFPLTARIASRDAARSLGRTIPGVTAVMAITAITFAVGIGLSSFNAEAQRSYVPNAPHGRVTVSFNNPPSATQKSRLISALQAIQPISHAQAITDPAPLSISNGKTAPVTQFFVPSVNNGDLNYSPPTMTALVYSPTRSDANTCPLSYTLTSDASQTVAVTSPQASAVPTGTGGSTVDFTKGTSTAIGLKLSGTGQADSTSGQTDTSQLNTPKCQAYAAHDLSGPGQGGGMALVTGLAIDDGSSGAILAANEKDEVAQALASGKAVVFNPYDLSGGQALIQKTTIAQATPDYLYAETANNPTFPDPSLFLTGSTYTADSGEPTVVGLSRVSMPAVYINAPDARVTMIIPPAMATSMGMASMTQDIEAIGSTMPTASQQAQMKKAVFAIAGDNAALYVERGYQSGSVAVSGIILMAGWILCLLIIVITAGLGLADARRDMAVSAAIGAPPKLRRLLAGAYALIVSIPGVLAGFFAGLMFIGGIIGVSTHECDPSIGMNSLSAGLAQSTGSASTCTPSQFLTPGLSVHVPWLWVAALVVGLPLLTAVFMAAFTRSRIPLLARAE